MLKEFVNKFLGKDQPTQPRDAAPAAPAPAVPANAVRVVAARPHQQAAAPAVDRDDDSENGNLRARPVTAVKTREASPEAVTKLLSFRGNVLTAPGSVAELTPSQSRYIALIGMDNDTRKVLVVSKDYAMHHETSSARSHLRRKGHSWNPKDEILVDLDVIRKIYENSSHSTVISTSNRGETAQMQRDFITLLNRAAAVNASDIHLVVRRYEAVLKIRADGVMMKLGNMTSSTALELCQAAFAMTDTSDPTYMPLEYQGARVTEGSLKGLKFPEGVQAVRLQFNPLPSGGRYMIARLLYSQKVGSDADIDELGYAPNQIRQIRDMRRKPFGINIISGPTGSGKSTTLQRGLTALMREKSGINVITIEDPPEYVIAGASQLPVTNAKTAEERSEKFRQAITAALRSDPDVIMIGEIRDGASAQLAFEAAMTGHLVWASLHANTAVSILGRLRDQKVESYKLCDGTLVSGLVGQRLVRKINKEHAISFEEGVNLGFIDKKSAEKIRELAGHRLGDVRFAGTHLFKDVATTKAYSGRSVVAEVILTDQNFLDLVKEDKVTDAVKYWLDHLEGMTMLEHGFVLMCRGMLDPRELEEKVGLLRDIDPKRIDVIFKLFDDEE